MKLEVNETNREAIKKMWPELIEDPSRVIKLKTGEVLCNRYGKYQPNICFVLNGDNVTQTWEPAGDYNIPWDGDAMEIRGDYWVSKKGTHCFRPKKDGTHVLIRVDWGGAFISTRGDEYRSVCKLAEYSRCAASNGGGSGYNFYVFPKGFYREVSIEEI